MTKRTVRDEIWETTIDLAVNGVQNRPELDDSEVSDGHVGIYKSSHNGEGFLKNDVLVRVNAGDRTVHDVLKTMVDMGLLATTTRILRRLEDRHHGKKTKPVKATVYYRAGDLRGGEAIDGSELIGSTPLDMSSGGGLEQLDDDKVAERRRETGLE